MEGYACNIHDSSSLSFILVTITECITDLLYGVKGGYLDFSHPIELKMICITEIHMKKKKKQ